ncbi:uncharacterized protein LOC111196509 [Astyanax mexicanus]|uniref:uncharacterized protein LOC111196509 n=1 Tax=Astyanax mexicanus TaxID=7994 RepID=UPI000BBD65F6|nr:uncharacterized protein LOC111196509 [Astyanax mexicanus]
MAGQDCPSRYVWTDEETSAFLDLIDESNINAILDGKQQRNAQMYQELQQKMSKKGFEKPWPIMRSKWKALKQRYMSEKRQQSASGAAGKTKTNFRFFEKMDNILGQRPIVTSLADTINSSGDGETTMAGQDGHETDTAESETSFERPEEQNPAQGQGEQQGRPPASTSQRFWRRSSVRSKQVETGQLYETFLKQQQEQAEREQGTLQSIATVLSQAVQCFERCAEAAERHAHATEIMAGMNRQGSGNTLNYSSHHSHPNSSYYPHAATTQPPKYYSQQSTPDNGSTDSPAFPTYFNLE